MFLYVLIFLNSCLSTKSRQISSVESNEKIWYLGFDKRLTNPGQDSSWSPKLYYSPALDNLRKFGNYSYTEKNDQREYLKDKFNKEGHSLYPTLEKLLLVLFPSPLGSLSITSSSDTNINTYISRLIDTQEFALAKILNTVYRILSLSKEEVIQNKKILLETLQEELKPSAKTFKINVMVNKIFNPIIEFTQQTSINVEEKNLIEHAFMKWALMHVDITNTKSIHNLINQLIFFEEDQEHNNSHQQEQLSEAEKLFQEAQIGFSHPENIYLANSPFDNGNTYAFDEIGEQIQELFPDCVETTIRHFFNYALKKNGRYHVLKNFNKHLQEYYKDANDEKVLGSDIMSRTTWNKVVSHIPEAQYRKKKNELKSNISNILHVIEYLLTNKSKDFQELTSDDLIHKKFKDITTILNTIKPISLTSSSMSDDKYTLDDFFVINNINKIIEHTYITIKRNNENSKKVIKVNSKNFTILEYSFLTNFFFFQSHQLNDSKKTIPLFNLYIHDSTTILNFFDQSNKQDETHLNTFSSYIGRVLDSALWSDQAIVKKIYQDKNLVDIINKVNEKPENILKGIQSLILENNYKKESEFILSPVLINKSKSINNLQTIAIQNITSTESETLVDIISNNKASIKKIIIRDQKNTMDKIFSTILFCTNLEHLDSQFSPCKYNLPPELGKLSKLKKLILTFNDIPGFIPDSLGNLSDLEVLKLQNNELIGPIPNTLGNLTKLKELTLFNNSLTGLIPSSLGLLKNLEFLDLGFNELTGSIPKEFENLTQLKQLSLSCNRLSGKIPEKLFVKNHISLAKNNLQGTIPKNIEKYKETINPQIKIIRGKEIEYNLLVDYK